MKERVEKITGLDTTAYKKELQVAYHISYSVFPSNTRSS